MYSGLVLTTTMPARSTPNSAIGYCRMFGIIRATRSPADQSGLVLQPCRECAAELVELRVGQGGTHVGECRRVSVGGTGLVEHSLQRGIAVGVDVRRHPGWVLVQPISIQARRASSICNACIAPVSGASNVSSGR